MNSDKLIVFLIDWAVNSVVLLIISGLLGKEVALGNMHVAGPMSAVVCTFIFTLIVYFGPLLASRLDFKLKDERVYIFLYAFLLLPVIWILKSLSSITGLGISNNFFIPFIAIIISAVQFYSTKYSQKYLQKL